MNSRFSHPFYKYISRTGERRKHVSEVLRAQRLALPRDGRGDLPWFAPVRPAARLSMTIGVTAQEGIVFFRGSSRLSIDEIKGLAGRG
jgi:hypothetical protein